MTPEARRAHRLMLRLTRVRISMRYPSTGSTQALQTPHTLAYPRDDQ